MKIATEAPRYQQISESLRAQIAGGVLAPGDKLPSFSEMRTQGVSQNTMEKVYALLEREELIVRTHGSGIFVAPARPPRRMTGLIGMYGSRPCRERSPYWGQLVEGVEDEAHRAGYEVLLMRSDREPVSRKDVDGILLAHYSELEWAEECGVDRTLIRVSCGLEPTEVILERFGKALALA